MATDVIRASVVPARVAAWLWTTLVVLLVAHAVGLFLTFGLGYSHARGLVPLFNIATESNVPTWFASALLMLGALLFLFLSRLSRPGTRERRVWQVLSATFAFLSVDEFAMIHELLIEPVRAALGTSGVLFFAWVIPYGIAVVLLGVMVGPTLWRLERRFRVLLGTSAALYLLGAIGVEMIGGSYYEAHETVVDLNYRLIQTVEETLEFSGLILLVYTLLELIGARSPVTRFELVLARPAATPERTAHAALLRSPQSPSSPLSAPPPSAWTRQASRTRRRGGT